MLIRITNKVNRETSNDKQLVSQPARRRNDGDAPAPLSPLIRQLTTLLNKC